MLVWPAHSSTTSVTHVASFTQTVLEKFFKSHHTSLHTVTWKESLKRRSNLMFQSQMQNTDEDMLTVLDTFTSLEAVSFTKSLNTLSVHSQSSNSSTRGRVLKYNRHYKITSCVPFHISTREVFTSPKLA